MGDLDVSGPVKWLRLTQDAATCNLAFDHQDGRAATHRSTSNPACFYVEMGLKGALAQDQDEPPLAFNEGSGSSQMGSVDCDPNIPQGQILTDGIVQGCSPFYAANKFETNPLCPDQNQFFTLPKSAPFDDWPPFDCVKTRPTGTMNQLPDGLNMRLFGVTSKPTCPAEIIGSDGQPRFTPGRNYWHRANNSYTGGNFAWNGDTELDESDDVGNRIHPADPRLVNLFFTPYNSFSGSGQEVFPVVALGTFYITGYGRIGGNGELEIEDPCGDGSDFSGYAITANEPPPDLNTSGGKAGGSVVWGHFIKNFVQSATADPSEKICEPLESFQPCVATLVE
jgi:hypothetical protein